MSPRRVHPELAGAIDGDTGETGQGALGGYGSVGGGGGGGLGELKYALMLFEDYAWRDAFTGDFLSFFEFAARHRQFGDFGGPGCEAAGAGGDGDRGGAELPFDAPGFHEGTFGGELLHEDGAGVRDVHVAEGRAARVVVDRDERGCFELAGCFTGDPVEARQGAGLRFA